MSVNIKVGAELDAADLNRQLADLTRRINATGQAIAQASRVRFDPIPKATVEMAQRIEQTMRNLARLAPDLHQRLKASGQVGLPFDHLDWTRLYTDPGQRLRAQRGLFSLATGLNFGPAGIGAGGGALTSPAVGQQIGTSIANAFERVLRAAGPAGRVAAHGLYTGRLHAAQPGGGLGVGVAAGIGAGLGFAAIGGLSWLAGQVTARVGAAQQESIGYADLYRRLGGRRGDNRFDNLRFQVRGASDQVAVTYEDALAMATMAARRGNLGSPGDVAGMLAMGAGFGRAFGFDPSASLGAFAGLRGVGVTRNVDDSRRLGLAIAEGIARAGVFAKAEEYLAEIASFGESATRATLGRANMEGYNAALAGMLALGIPGLDVRGSAALLNQADAALRRGGAAGEAGNAFLYQALGRRLGLDPLQTEALWEGGAFATARGTFGSGLVADFYRANGLPVPALGADADATTLELALQGLRGHYTGGNRRLLPSAAANLFGVSQRQAMALLSLQPAQIRGMAALGLGEEAISRLSATGIATMGRIAVGDRAELTEIANSLARRRGAGALTSEELARLGSAISNPSVEELRKVVAEIAASREAEETEGDRTRRTLQGIDKTIHDMATALIGPMNTARDALLVLAGRNGRALTAREVAARVREGEIAEANETAEMERRALRNEMASNQFVADTARFAELEARRIRGQEMSPQDQAEHQRLLRYFEDVANRQQAIERRRAAAIEAARQRYHERISGRVLPGTVSDRASQFAATLEDYGEGAITQNMALGLAANAIGESAVNPAAIGDGGASRGVLQWDAGRRANFRRLFGKDIEDATAEEQARFAVWELTSNDPANTERGRLAMMRDWVARQPGGDTPENWAEAFTRFYLRPADPNRDSIIRRAHAAELARRRAVGGPGLPTPPTPPTPAPGPANPAAAMPPGAAPNAVTNAATTPPPPTRVEGEIQGTFFIQGPNGMMVAPPVNTSTTLRPARPTGSLRP